MELLPGIHRLEVDYQDRLLNQHILVGTEAALIVDAGIDSTTEDVIFAYLDHILGRRQLQLHVLITHSDADHCGGLGALQARYPGIRSYAHEAERPLVEDPDMNIRMRYAEFAAEGVNFPEEIYESLRHKLGMPGRIDRTLRGGETFRLSPDWRVEAVHTPGHTKGHMIVYDARSRCAIIGDAALGKGVPARDGGWSLCPTNRLAADYLQTLDVISGLQPEFVLGSHYPVIRGSKDIARFLKESRAFVYEVEEHILQELLRQERVTLSGLLASADGRLGAWPRERNLNLYYVLQGGLEKLEADGLIRRERNREAPGWIWSRVSSGRRLSGSSLFM